MFFFHLIFCHYLIWNRLIVILSIVNVVEVCECPLMSFKPIGIEMFKRYSVQRYRSGIFGLMGPKVGKSG